MTRSIRTAILLFSLILGATSAAFAANAVQTPLTGKAHPANHYPKIVLYSVSWCPHCKAAKEYFTEHNIPFINRDVELDPKAMQELTGTYKSNAVPVIVLGNDARILKGFTPEMFEQAVKELRQK